MKINDAKWLWKSWNNLEKLEKLENPEKFGKTHKNGKIVIFRFFMLILRLLFYLEKCGGRVGKWEGTVMKWGWKVGKLGGRMMKWGEDEEVREEDGEMKEKAENEGWEGQWGGKWGSESKKDGEKKERKITPKFCNLIIGS